MSNDERVASERDDHQRFMDVAPCECPGAGWCERHTLMKTAHLHKLCRTRSDYRNLWDQHPGNKLKKPSVGFVDKAKNLGAAMKKWLAAGRPLRSEQRVQQIFDQHCTPCESFIPSDKGGKCRECGCVLKRIGGLRNKISWATEGCPLDKWHAEINP